MKDTDPDNPCLAHDLQRDTPETIDTPGAVPLVATQSCNGENAAPLKLPHPENLML